MIALDIDIPVLWQALVSPPALVRYVQSPDLSGSAPWRLVRRDGPSRQPLDSEPGSNGPLGDSGVDLVLAEEGKDLQGRWLQRFEVTIKPGGTLADASRVLYGDERRAPELLDAIRKRNPNVDAQHIPVGLKIGITVDPSVSFVLKDTRREGDWQISSFYNGAVERKRANARIVELPADKPAQEFAVPGDTSDRPVPAGARLLEYQYRAGETFDQAVAIVYGTASIETMKHFISQTGVDVNNWPPPPLDRLRIVVAPGTDLADEPIVEVPAPLLPSGQYPPGMAQLRQEQDQQRRQAGIFRVQTGPYTTTYRLRVIDAEVAARQAAALIYNDPERWIDVAQAAGLKVTKDQPQTNTRLQGREFDLQTEYDEEWFALGDPAVDEAKGSRQVRLLNGTLVASATKGPNRIITLPTGYRKVVYQPSELGLALARIIAYVFKSGEGGAAHILYEWDPGVPRQPGGTVETASLAVQNKQVLLRVQVAPARSAGMDPVALLRQLTPCLFAVGAVFLGTLLVVVVGRASAPKPYRRRH